MLSGQYDRRSSPALRRRSAASGAVSPHATIEFAEAKKWAWRDLPPVKWLRIVVIDGPRRAWTNPIWVDAFNLTEAVDPARSHAGRRMAFALARRSARPYMRRLPNGSDESLRIERP